MVGYVEAHEGFSMLQLRSIQNPPGLSFMLPMNELEHGIVVVDFSVLSSGCVELCQWIVVLCTVLYVELWIVALLV